MGLPLEKFPDWPAAMDRDMALAYTGVAETQLKQWMLAGKVRFSPRGPRGAMLTLRADLDDALHSLFEGGGGEDPIEF